MTVAPALERVAFAFLGEEFDEALNRISRGYAWQRAWGGRVGSAEWLKDMEALTGRVLAPGKRGAATARMTTGTRNSVSPLGF